MLCSPAASENPGNFAVLSSGSGSETFRKKSP